jgi:hypothetical protein
MDPTTRIERKTASLIKKSDIPEEVAKKVIPQASVPPRLYGLPKIHKKHMPLRLIVNCIASPTYLVAKHLTGLLSLFVRQTDHHIKNSKAFIQKLNTISLQETDILVSIHVVSLFTKVPLEDTLQMLPQHFHNWTISLFRQVLTTSYFLYYGMFYDKTDGVTMGSPLAPVIANYYMEYFEQLAISSVIRKPTH